MPQFIEQSFYEAPRSRINSPFGHWIFIRLGNHRIESDPATGIRAWPDSLLSLRLLSPHMSAEMASHLLGLLSRGLLNALFLVTVLLL